MEVPFLLDRSTALHRLVAMGVIAPADVLEGGWTIRDASSRNRNYVVRKQRRGFFVKSPNDLDPARAAALQREFRCCRAAAGDRSLRSRMPLAVRFHDRTATAVFRWIPESRNGIEQFRYHRNDGVAKRIGRCLAVIHDRLGRAIRLADEAPDLPSHRPSCFEPMLLGRTTGDISTGQQKVLSLVAARPRLVRLLAAAGEAWRTTGLIHGDAKLSNVLLDEREGCRLIDWESVGLGDPAWDVAGVIQSFIGLWIHTLVPPGGAADAPESGDVAFAIMAAHIAAFVDEYFRAAALPAAIERAARERGCGFAGARLVQSAFEQSRGTDEMFGQTALHLQMAELILAAPGEYMACLGLARGARAGPAAAAAALGPALADPGHSAA